MKNLKLSQIKTVLILSFLILVFHFIIMFTGDFPGGQYGMAPFLLIIGLPILGLLWFIVLFLLNYFKVNLSSLKVAMFYTISYLLVALMETSSLNDVDSFKLFIVPGFISFLLFWTIRFFVKNKSLK